jgi:preprotein translocase subunit YajC
MLSSPLPMLILMFVIFYFLLIRPQQKKAKAQREMLSSLRKGDNVITSGGIYGTITGIDDQIVVLEIAPQVRVKMSRASVSGVAGAAAPAKQAKADDKKKK